MFAWRIAVLPLLLPVLATACALPPWVHGVPQFPENQGASWELPLYEPLTQVGPHVVGTFCGAVTRGRPPPCEEVVLFVDSGSSRSALREATFDHLHITTTTSRVATVEDVGGVKRSWSGALIPEARFGAHLAVRDLVATVHDSTPILGADVLAARGWQLDLDRGTLLLGAATWPEDPGVTAVPTRNWGAHAIVDLTVQGTPVSVLLDTGALVTVVERELMRGLGRAERQLGYPFPLGKRPDSPRLDSAFDVEVALGGRNLGRRSITALPVAGAVSTHGMLGFDILSVYSFQVTAMGLRLRPREASLTDDVATRIARWGALPNCPDPGCVAAAPVAPGDHAARVRVRFAASYPRAMRFLFACSDDHGRLDNFPLWLEVSVSRPTAGTEVETALEGAAPQVRQLWGSHCMRLTLIDVNPVIESVRPLGADVESRVALDSRNAHLR